MTRDTGEDDTNSWPITRDTVQGQPCEDDTNWCDLAAPSAGLAAPAPVLV
jgi:hypothetical protein